MLMNSIFVQFDPAIQQTASSGEHYAFLPILLPIMITLFVFSPFPAFPASAAQKISAALIPGWSDSNAIRLKGLSGTLLSVFFMILSLNLLSLLPYALGFTSQLYLAITLAIPLWGSIVLSGWSKSLKVAAASLVPQGAPMALGPFVAILETISLLVRPVSLSLRLVVNISAGHLLLSLMSQLLLSMTQSYTVGAILMFLITIGYFLFEVGISLIQAYIFTTLLALYTNDHPTN